MELLTVFVILSILVSITISSVLAAKAKARGVVCINNLRQQGIVLEEFVSTYNRYPLSFVFPQDRELYPENVGGSWDASLFSEHHRNDPSAKLSAWKEILRCPTARRPKELEARFGYESYGYNADGLVGQDKVGNLGLGGTYTLSEGNPKQRPVDDSDVASPSEMIAVGDAVIGWGEILQDGLLKIGRSAEAVGDSKSLARVLKRHRGNLKVLFCDEHVEAIKIKRLFSSTDNTALSIWNRDHLPHRERLE